MHLLYWHMVGKNKLKQKKHMESARGIIVNKTVTKRLADKMRNKDRLEEDKRLCLADTSGKSIPGRRL